VIVVVTGANGLVGSGYAALTERSAGVRAVVRRPGAAPAVPGVAEQVGDFTDTGCAATVLAGADAAVTTVHPMGSDGEVQRRVGVEGTRPSPGPPPRPASSASSTSRRPPRTTGQLQSVMSTSSRRWSATTPATIPSPSATPTSPVATVDGRTRVRMRPPAIPRHGRELGLERRAAGRDPRREAARHAVPHQAFEWVHVDPLVALAADVATARVAASTDPASGPVADARTPVNVATGRRPSATTTRVSLAPSASRRSGTTHKRGRPAARRPTAPTAEAGLLRSGSARRSTRSPGVCG
jgi:hypothetical protein